jgi:hypothetical protein
MHHVEIINTLIQRYGYATYKDMDMPPILKLVSTQNKIALIILLHHTKLV